MEEEPSFPYGFPVQHTYHNYELPIVDGEETRDQPDYYLPDQLTGPFPHSNAMARIHSRGASFPGTPDVPTRSTQPSPMVPIGPQTTFATAYDHIPPQNRCKHPGVAQQLNFFKMESPNLSSGSSTTPETFSSGALITPEDHPQQQQPPSKRKKLGSATNAIVPAASNFRQYTVPPPRKTQQRTVASSSSSNGASHQSPEEAAAEKSKASALEVEELRKSRNRVAANKCRQKKKEGAAKLEETNVSLQHRNADLEAELRGLKDEVIRLNTLLMEHACCGDANIDQYIQNRAERIVAKPKMLFGKRFTFAPFFLEGKEGEEPSQSKGFNNVHYQFDTELPFPGSTVMKTVPSPPVLGFENSHQQRTDSLSSVSASASTSGYAVQTPGQQGITTPGMFHGHHHHQLGTIPSAASSSFSQPFQGLPSPPPMQLQLPPTPSMRQQQLGTNFHRSSSQGQGQMRPMTPQQQSMFSSTNFGFDGSDESQMNNHHSDPHHQQQQQHNHGLLEDMLAPGEQEAVKDIVDGEKERDGDEEEEDDDNHGLDFGHMQISLPDAEDPIRRQLNSYSDFSADPMHSN